jgi:hypothetical protein
MRVGNRVGSPFAWAVAWVNHSGSSPDRAADERLQTPPWLTESFSLSSNPTE